MQSVGRLLKKGGWKKGPAFTQEQMGKIGQELIINLSPGFILCPFGFKGEIDKSETRQNISPSGGLKPGCPVHGDNCPGLRKLL